MNEQELANASYDAAQDRMRLLPNYYKWMYSYFAAHLRGKVAELGAGAGHLLPYYVNSVEHVYALDHNPLLLDAMLSKHGDAKVTAVLADLRSDFPGALECKVDTVIALDVLEHFEEDEAFVAKAARLLTAGGCMIVKVPASSELYGDMDKASGHYRRYDPNQLRRLMRGAGLEEVSLESFNRPGALMYRRRRSRKSNFSKTFSPAVLKGINMAIPFVALMDRFIPGKGLSLVGVYRKP